MARRKQQNPRHLESSHDLAASLQNGISSSSDSEDDEHVCGKCRAEFPSLSDFLKHKQACVSKRPVLLLDNGKSIHGDDDNDSDDLPPPRLTAALDPPSVQNGLFLFPKNYSPKVSDLSQLVQRLSDTNVTLEELRNTTVAVAQHGRLLQETQLAALLSNIHQQQVAQLHVIQELQTQILGAQETSSRVVPLVGTAALTPPQSGSDSAMGAAPPNGAQPSAPTSARTSTTSKPAQADVSDERQTGLPIYEPNTLELLQRHTEQALQNTMSGGSFLLNTVGNSSELAKLKRTKDGKIDEAASRHRCKFCGKVFGSDSSLQIHIRSHTGERPFKCSVCNSCFSTKGNLKVHFQRHKENLEVPTDLQINDNHSSSVASNVFDQVQPTNDQALDFSTSLNGKTTPSNEQHIGSRSRSATPNDISNLSDDSIDPSDHCGENVNIPLALDDRHFDEEDDDDNDDDRGSNSSAVNNLDDDFDNNLQQIDPHSFTFASPTFTPFFRPISFGASLSDGSSMCLPSSLVPPPTSQSNQDSHMHHQDPQAYQDLLPRIGSNDNSWESLMEVTDTSETSKLQKLVDKIEVLDPNQCGFCHRVLSCKSALLMHYRTHTGERPFRCKICGRAFTTKGNLKTHMSVHRHKPPSRVLHQCPVCHKQFANSVILQQHIRMHTGGNTVLLQDPVFYRDEESPTLLPPSYPRPMLMPSQLATNSEPLALVNNDSRRQMTDSQQLKNPDTVIKTTNTDLQPSDMPSPAASSSSSQSSPQTPSIVEPTSQEDVKSALFEKSDDDGVANKSGHISPTHTGILKPPTPMIQEKQLSPKSDYDRLITQNNLVSNLKIATEGQGIEKRPENSVEHVEKPKPIQNQHTIVSIANDKPLPMTLPSDCPIPLNLNSEKHMLSMNVPSTTSDYTASLAALENHVKAINSSTTNPLPFPPTLGLGFSMPNYYRSEYNLPTYHSKDKMRPFSPPNGKVNSDLSADERSTPGSVIKEESPKPAAPARSESGALDLTPRGTASSTTPQRLPSDLNLFTPLAGLPFASPHLARLGTTCQICFKTFACQSALEIHYRSHTKERPFKCEVCDRGFSTKGNMKQHMLTHKIRDLPAKLFTSTLSQSPNTQSSTTSPSSPSTPLPTLTTESPIFSIAPSVTKKFEEMPVKRPSNEGNHPHPPKRSPGVPKHVCEVCHKPFSSGSALQIHMRTHTGIKPFQCNICSRAFTTKGNLKVHMGTHLSNNGTSRRGRRMSLDIPPLSLPLGKHGEYPPPRHDMFFPYLPPFINGMSRPFPPPKMNEISVIQSAGGRDDADSSAVTSRAMVMPPPNVSLGINVSRPLALVTTSHNSKSNISLQKGEELTGKSPTRKRELFSPISRGPDAIQMVERNASWSWKIACNYCNKICSSSVELELHINKEHTKTEQRENHETVVSKT